MPCVRGPPPCLLPTSALSAVCFFSPVHTLGSSHRCTCGGCGRGCGCPCAQEMALASVRCTCSVAAAAGHEERVELDPSGTIVRRPLRGWAHSTASERFIAKAPQRRRARTASPGTAGNAGGLSAARRPARSASAASAATFSVGSAPPRRSRGVTVTTAVGYARALCWQSEAAVAHQGGAL